MYYAVIDINVLISALLSRPGHDSAPSRVVNYIFQGELITIYNNDILEEYEDVLNREKFNFDPGQVENLILQIKSSGLHEDAFKSDEVYPDPDDAVFFEVALSHYQSNDNTYLVTGNIKYFPAKIFVINPRQMVEIIENMY